MQLIDVHFQMSIDLVCLVLLVKFNSPNKDFNWLIPIQPELLMHDSFGRKPLFAPI